MNQLEERLERIKQLNRGRFDYVMLRAQRPQPTIEEASDKMGRNRKWYYDLPQEERAELEALADDLHKNTVIHAFMILQQAAVEAAQVKTKGLQERDPRVRQAAATDILDRTVGKAEEKLDITASVNLVWQPHKSTGSNSQD